MVLLKNYARDLWPLAPLSPELRTALKDALQRLALRAPGQVAQQAVFPTQILAIAAIIRHESLSPDWLGRLLTFPSHTPASYLEALDLLLSETEEKLSRCVGTILAGLLQTYTVAKGEVRRKALAVLYRALEVIAWADSSEPETVNAELTTWPDWHQLLLQGIESPETVADLKAALRVLSLFYRDFPLHSKDFLPAAIKPVWVLMYSILPHFYHQVLYSKHSEDLETEDEDYSGMHGVAALLLDLLSSLTLRPAVRQAVQLELVPIIRTLANYLLLSADQARQKDSDPAQFLLEEEGETGTRSARSGALKLISELVEVFREDAVRGVISVADMLCRESLVKVTRVKERAMTSQAEIMDFVARINGKIDEVTSRKSKVHAWKSREAAMLLLGKTSNDILALNLQLVKRSDAPVDLQDTLSSVLPLLLTVNKTGRVLTLLRGRSLWTLARLSDLVTPDSRSFAEVLDLCIDCSREKYEVSVRFSACFAISKLGKHPSPPFLDRLPQLLGNLFQLATVTDEDTLRLVLETIKDLSSLSEDTTALVAKQYAGRVLGLFSAYYGDTALGGDITALLRLWADIPQAAESLAREFVPYIGKLLRVAASAESPLPTALDLLQMLLVKLQAGSKEATLVLDLLPALLQVLGTSQDVPLLLHGTNCLRAFIATFHEQLLARKYGDSILETVAKLLSPALNESAAPHLGYCLVQVFDKISPNVDEDLVLACVTKLYKSKMPSIVQGLVLVCARLIHLNANALVSFLLDMTVERRPGLKVLMDKWLIHQPLIRGKYTKNATVSALARLFTLKDKRLEALLVIGFNPSHSNLSPEVPVPMKILSTLIRCLDNEAAPRKQKAAQVQGLNEEFNTVVDAGGLGLGGHIDFDEGERVDTIEDDEVFEKEEDQGDAMAGLKKQLLNEVQEDFEGAFLLQEKKAKGLGDYETGSECLMSDMLDFDYDDGEELGEDFYEDDLYSLGDWYGSLNLQNFLLEFFGRLIENDKDYLMSCFRHMLAEDVALFKKHFSLV